MSNNVATHNDVTHFAPAKPRVAVRTISLAGFWEWVRFAIAVMIVPEVPPLLWYIQTHLAIQFRGWINSEYLLLVCVALLLPSRRMILILTAELTIALIEPIAHLYYLPPSVALFSIGFVHLFPASRLTEYGALLTGYVALCYLLLRTMVGVRPRSMGRAMAGIALLLALLPPALDVTAGRFYKIHVGPEAADVDLNVGRVTRAPVASLLKALMTGLPNLVTPRSQNMPSALDLAINALPVRGRPDIVLVLTESWGLALDDSVNQAQFQAYNNGTLRSLYRVEKGTVAFNGATTSGETRELCGDSIGSESISQQASFYAECWPARLAQKGYHTFATHGFSESMFNRGIWYGRFGFEQTAFRSELERGGARVCDGPFPGACDADVARLIGDRLSAKRDSAPTFVHWVTLNSHLPIASLPEGTTVPECVALKIEGERSLCSWFEHVLVVHRSVAELAVRPGLRPTVFVIVGDHAPPFLRPALRERFSQTEVPYVILVPRSLDTNETHTQPGAKPRLSMKVAQVH